MKNPLATHENCMCPACWLSWAVMANNPGGHAERGHDERGEHWVIVRGLPGELHDWLFDAAGRQIALLREMAVGHD